MVRAALIVLLLAGCAAPPPPLLGHCEQLAMSDSVEARRAILTADCEPGSAVTVDVDRLTDDRFRIRVR